MKNQYKLYDGKIILEFDEAKHIYTVNDKPVYGVTSITGIIAKPALTFWAANQGSEAFKANVNAGDVLDEVKIKQLCDLIKTAHTQTKNAAADIGTMIHDWLSAFLKAGLEKKPLPKKPINPEMKNAINAFLDWTVKNKVKFYDSERKVYSAKYKYAGTLDAMAMVNGKRTIVDFKTGNAIYPEMFLQTAAYQYALTEETKQKYTHNLILRLSKGSEDIKPFEVMETPNLKENFKAFLSCLVIYRWQMQNKKVAILNSIK